MHVHIVGSQRQTDDLVVPHGQAFPRARQEVFNVNLIRVPLNEFREIQQLTALGKLTDPADVHRDHVIGACAAHQLKQSLCMQIQIRHRIDDDLDAGLRLKLGQQRGDRAHTGIADGQETNRPLLLSQSARRADQNKCKNHCKQLAKPLLHE